MIFNIISLVNVAVAMAMLDVVSGTYYAIYQPPAPRVVIPKSPVMARRIQNPFSKRLIEEIDLAVLNLTNQVIFSGCVTPSL